MTTTEIDFKPEYFEFETRDNFPVRGQNTVVADGSDAAQSAAEKLFEAEIAGIDTEESGTILRSYFVHQDNKHVIERLRGLAIHNGNHFTFHEKAYPKAYVDALIAIDPSSYNVIDDIKVEEFVGQGCDKVKEMLLAKASAKTVAKEEVLVTA